VKIQLGLGKAEEAESFFKPLQTGVSIWEDEVRPKRLSGVVEREG